MEALASTVVAEELERWKRDNLWSATFRLHHLCRGISPDPEKKKKIRKS